MQANRIISVADDSGNVKRLAGKIADGGEGSIHAVDGRSDVLVKIYHPAILTDTPRCLRLEYKIRAMSQHPELRVHPHLAWPLLPLHAPGFGWCGYAMWRKPGTSLRALLGSPLQLARSCPHWHRQHLVRLCLDYLDTLAFLAANRALPVDFNPGNLIIDCANVRVNFIDCGGFQFQSAGRLYQGESITPDMAAPETLRQTNAGMCLSTASVRFSAAMTLFYILTLGNSPYRHRNGDDPVQNLIHGSCALGKGAAHALPSGSFYRIWSHLIFDLKELFLRCFCDGHGRPELRPAVSEWRTALHKYNRCLVIGHAEASLVPGKAKAATRYQNHQDPPKTNVQIHHPQSD